MRKLYFLSVLFLTLLLLPGCDSETGKINIFSVEDDIAFGEQMRDEILYSGDYNVLDKSEYPEAYAYMDDLKTQLLNSGEVAHTNDFVWEVYLIDDDVVNAFATPGGYIYFYTGLLDVLENEAQLAGVMAHEMAHCALRHSTNQMTSAYGVQILLSILLGENPSQLEEIAASLAGGLGDLAFSRKHEYEADEYAIRYMANGTGGQDGKEMATFFDILEALSGGSQTPAFLSTHPSPEDRKEKILEHWDTYGQGKEGVKNSDEFNGFRNLLN